MSQTFLTHITLNDRRFAVIVVSQHRCLTHHLLDHLESLFMDFGQYLLQIGAITLELCCRNFTRYFIKTPERLTPLTPECLTPCTRHFISGLYLHRTRK